MPLYRLYRQQEANSGRLSALAPSNVCIGLTRRVVCEGGVDKRKEKDELRSSGDLDQDEC